MTSKTMLQVSMLRERAGQTRLPSRQYVRHSKVDCESVRRSGVSLRPEMGLQGQTLRGLLRDEHENTWSTVIRSTGVNFPVPERIPGLPCPQVAGVPLAKLSEITASPHHPSSATFHV